MNIRTIIIIVLFALGVVRIGHAEELAHRAITKSVLFSPAVFINHGTLTECRVVNVSHTSRKITAQIFRGFEGLDATEFSDCDEVLPRTTCAALYQNQTGGGHDGYCKIIVERLPRHVRGVLTIRGICNATCETSVAVEARYK